MREVRVRRAHRFEARAVAAILASWTEESPWLPSVRSRDEERRLASAMIARGWVTVARRRGRVVGFLARDGGEVHALYLNRRARGQGIGRRLLEVAKAEAPALSLYAHADNRAARAFYLREGFREIGAGDGAGNDEGLPEIRLLWERPAA